MMNLIFLGPPGTGKGTQAVKIAEHFSIPHISTGDMFRCAIKEEIELGIAAKSYIDKGKLVPDVVVIGLVKERLSLDDVRKGWILDGFPRTLKQAKALDAAGIVIDKVINLDSEIETVVKRISNRRTCKQCGAVFNLITLKPKVDGFCDVCGGDLIQREDEKEATVRDRMKVYEQETKPLISYYENKDLLITIDGNRDIPEIFSDIVSILDQ